MNTPQDPSKTGTADLAKAFQYLPPDVVASLSDNRVIREGQQGFAGDVAELQQLHDLSIMQFKGAIDRIAPKEKEGPLGGAVVRASNVIDIMPALADKAKRERVKQALSPPPRR